MPFSSTLSYLNKYRKEHPFVFYFMAVYLGGLSTYLMIFLIWFADYTTPMPLNEVGDFLAGSFSPIAFLFLYLGYRQNSEALRIQAEELRQSTEALKLQVEEMEKSVKTQQEMFELAEKQYLESHEEKIKNSTPQIQLIGSKYKRADPYHSGTFLHQFNLTIKVENLSIKNLNLRMSAWYVVKSGGSMNDSMTLDINSIDANRSEILVIYKKTNHAPFNNDHLYLSYYDEYGTKYQKTYEFTNTEDNIVVLKEKILES